MSLIWQNSSWLCCSDLICGNTKVIIIIIRKQKKDWVENEWIFKRRSCILKQDCQNSWLPAKIAAYLVSISQLLCLAFLYGWDFWNKISLDWLLTLTTQPSTSKLSDNPVLKQGAKKVIFTVCHLGKLRLAYTSPNIISTSPKNFLMSRIDFTALL